MLSNCVYLGHFDRSLFTSVWVCITSTIFTSECSLWMYLVLTYLQLGCLVMPFASPHTHTHARAQLARILPTLIHTQTAPVAMSLLRTGTGAGCVGECMNKALCKPFTTGSHSHSRLWPFKTFITKPVTLHKVEGKLSQVNHVSWKVSFTAGLFVGCELNSDGCWRVRDSS